jgi:hypothetical protein
MQAAPSTRFRVTIAVAIGLATGVFCWLLLAHLKQGAGDFRWAIDAAQSLLASQNPYAEPQQLYPLPAALFGLPFVRLSREMSAGIFFGVSSGLLAFGLTRDGYRRLLVFLAYPYWACLLAAQWGPLIMASTFFPILLPATLAKPQTGIPVALTHMTRRGLIACLVTTVITFLWMPNWLGLWIQQLGKYEHFFPLLILPGPLLALALLRYRSTDARLFMLTALLPQRWFYDPFILWLIPKSRREIVWTVFCSWGAGIWRWYHIPHSLTDVARTTIVFLYLPILLVLLMRPVRPTESA